ncbi:hypothetical protein MKEN_00960300 [Mycena kentingensis (nom. inval.)]|nr:hypothetical protein MKEN_00960300 [Mycena kentingensis (nom. inval.)]
MLPSTTTTFAMRLPAELWDLVFRYIYADHWLLRAAGTCRIFNHLAIRLYLKRKKLLLGHEHTIRLNRETLDGLRTSCSVVVRARNVTCHCVGTGDLAALAAVLKRDGVGSGIASLELKYRPEPHGQPKEDSSVVVGHVHDIIEALARIGGGRVFVLPSIGLERELALSAFSLDEIRETLAPTSLSRRWLRRTPAARSSEPILAELLDRHFGHPTDLSLRIGLHAAEANNPNFTLVSLGDAYSLHIRKTPRISATDLAVVLPHLSSFRLHSLILHTLDIDPFVLGCIVGCSLRLHRLEIRPMIQPKSIPPLLCRPPTPAESLRFIDCPNAALLPPLLASVFDSPLAFALTVCFGIRFGAERRTHTADRASALRAVALWGEDHAKAIAAAAGRRLRAGLDLRLSVLKSERWTRPLVFDAEEREILASPGIATVRYMTLWVSVSGGLGFALGDVRSLFPWLAYFTSLQQLEIMCAEEDVLPGASRLLPFREKIREGLRGRWVAEIRAALPGVGPDYGELREEVLNEALLRVICRT